MNWKPGDLALIECSSSLKDTLNIHGKTVTLIKYIGNGTVIGEVKMTASDLWHIDCGQGNQTYGRESTFRKPYDGHDKCSWEDCIWEPDRTGISVAF